MSASKIQRLLDIFSLFYFFLSGFLQTLMVSFFAPLFIFETEGIECVSSKKRLAHFCSPFCH